MTAPRDPEQLKRLQETAIASFNAGEALPPLASTRSLTPAPYKYGMHIGNWTDGMSDGLLRETEATKPTSVLFMGDFKAEAVDRLNPHVAPNGLWIFRLYFPPDGGSTTATNINNYAIEYKRRLGVYLAQSTALKKAYDEGRLVLKPFNETNIGGEGFPRGRAGFTSALEAWKHVRNIIKAEFPKAKFMSIANTPGNDDVWFTGDAQNVPYWYHGAEAAKANPTAAEIQAAIQSCPMREMFELADYIGIHVYANLTSTVSGNLQTWYSRRHERGQTFLAPYLAQGKKMIVSECDMGYDEGQEVRAREFVWWLQNVVAPNDAIITINHWWNADKQEADPTWEKHNTRMDGEFRPVVHAVKAYRGNAPSEPTPVPVPTPTPPPEDSIDLPSWVSVERATVPVGQPYWHLKRAFWQDFDTSGGTHHIYVLSPHDPTKTFSVTNGSETWHTRLDKPTTEPAGNFAMWKRNVYSAWMDGSPSDIVAGMTMPQNQHVSYLFEWELRIKEGEPAPVPTPPDPVIRWDKICWAFEEAARIVKRDGFAKSHDWILQSPSYLDAIAQRDRRPAINRDRQSPNHSPRYGEKIDAVVLHHTGGGLTASLNHLCNNQIPLEQRVSAHYVISEEGAIYQLVDESRTAWHCGISFHNGRDDVNDFSIGIEIVNRGDGTDPYDPAQIAALVALLKDIKARRNIKRSDVVTHKAVARPAGRKNDPEGLDVESVLNQVY